MATVYESIVTRKPPFEISDQARHKVAYFATGTSQKLNKITFYYTIQTAIKKVQIAQVSGLISVFVICTCIKRFSHDAVHFFKSNRNQI